MVDTRRSSAAKRRGPTEESSPAPPPPTQAEAAASPTTAGAPAEPASTPPPPSSRSRSGKRAKVAVRPLFVHSCGVSVGATDGLIDLTPPPPLLFARLRGWRNPATRRWTRPRSTAPSRTCRAWRGRPPSTSPRPPPSPIPKVRGGFRLAAPPRLLCRLDSMYLYGWVWLVAVLDPVGFLVSRKEEEESAGEGVPDGRGDALEGAARQWPR